MSNNKKFFGSEGNRIDYPKKDDNENISTAEVTETETVTTSTTTQSDAGYAEHMIMSALESIRTEDLPKALGGIMDLKSGIEKLDELKVLPKEISDEVKNMSEIMEKFDAFTKRSETLNKEADVKSTEKKEMSKEKDYTKAKKEITSGEESSKWIPALVAAGTALAATGFDIVVSGDTSMERLVGTAAATVVAGGIQYAVQSNLTSEQSTLVNCGIGAAIGGAVGGSTRFAVNYFGEDSTGVEAEL